MRGGAFWWWFAVQFSASFLDVLDGSQAVPFLRGPPPTCVSVACRPGTDCHSAVGRGARPEAASLSPGQHVKEPVICPRAPPVLSRRTGCCVRRCVALGRMTCHPKDCPGSQSGHGRGHTYHCATHFLPFKAVEVQSYVFDEVQFSWFQIYIPN